VPAGEAFSERQVREISRTVEAVSAETGVRFSVFVGRPEEDPGEYAERLHKALPDPRHAALVMVAPNERRVEIVTGTEVRHRLTDRDCALAALSMTSSFSGGDLVGGIVTGLRMLADHARASGRAARAN
jgi:uncharacterized membrane protein YgcG